MGKFLAGPIGSALRVFGGAVLGALVKFLVDGNKLQALKPSDLSTWIAAGLVVAVPLLIAFVNPADPRFGSTSASGNGRATATSERGGYPPGPKTTGQLKPPPKGPAPGAKPRPSAGSPPSPGS